MNKKWCKAIRRVRENEPGRERGIQCLIHSVAHTQPMLNSKWILSFLSLFFTFSTQILVILPNAFFWEPCTFDDISFDRAILSSAQWAVGSNKVRRFFSKIHQRERCWLANIWWIFDEQFPSWLDAPLSGYWWLSSNVAFFGPSSLDWLQKETQNSIRAKKRPAKRWRLLCFSVFFFFFLWRGPRVDGKLMCKL